ncbi:MAG: hypothetical protein JWO33_434 [Caulobacteraceae bacterium]|nr:hypothetical protein [Caulobacteraceae bacterium]
MTSVFNSLSVVIPPARDDSSPGWGIAPNGGCRHQGRMRGWASKFGLAAGLAVFAASGAAHAAGGPARVFLNGTTSKTSTITPGNIIVPADGSTFIVAATNGAVSGTATRTTSGNMPLQTFSVVCNTLEGNCKDSYTVTVTATRSGKAITITPTISNLSCTIGPSTCAVSPPGSNTISIVNSANTGWTATFRVGYSVTLNKAPPAAAGWTITATVSP